jgi:hypothetical protein
MDKERLLALTSRQGLGKWLRKTVNAGVSAAALCLVDFDD